MLVLLHLSGCLFIFGPPDLSNVGSPTDSADSGSGTPTLPTATGETGGGSSGPEITSVTIEPMWDGLEFRLTLDSDEADLEGGDIVVDGAGPTIAFRIPDDVEVTDGLATFRIPLQVCGSWSYTFDIVVHDGEGNPGATVEVVSDAGGIGIVEETGFQPVALGIVDPIWSVCGSMESSTDTDRFTFGVLVDAELELSATWNSDGDLDFLVSDEIGTVGEALSTVQPEDLVERFLPGHVYTVEMYYVPAQNEPPPDLYQLLFLPVGP